MLFQQQASNISQNFLWRHLAWKTFAKMRLPIRDTRQTTIFSHPVCFVLLFGDQAKTFSIH